MCQGLENGRRRCRGDLLLLGAVLAMVFPAVVARAGEPVIYFSTEEPFTAKAGPHAGERISAGDLLSSTGHVIATNYRLLRNFGPMPPLPDVGLDGVGPRSSGEIVFSIEDGFWDERLGKQVRQGDLLSDKGTILRTNAELLANFSPMPSPDPDYGLDAVWERSGKEAWFSVENGFWDERLGTTVGHGDLLSQSGAIVRTNRLMLANFSPMPAPGADYGLDAVHVFDNGEIWFSIEQTFWDEGHGTWVGHGDVLSVGPKGGIVKTNAQLLAAFFDPTGEVPDDLGLDALWVAPPPGDANGDGKVDDLDASILAANWQRTGGAFWSQADFNGDGNVNDLDASILSANWQYGVGTAVPEPGAFPLLLGALAAVAALRARRRSGRRAAGVAFFAMRERGDYAAATFTRTAP